MTTINQLLKAPRRQKKLLKKNNALSGNPQQKAMCLRLLTMSPKKPNSANRRIAKISTLRLRKRLSIKIPGEGHNLQQHSSILIRSCRARDLIGITNMAIRGKLDFGGVNGRRSSRSIYGVKKPTN